MPLPVIFLFGPTATGKTNAALYLAEHLACNIISVDAIQVYRGLNIGSAKPSPNVLSKYPHHLIDIREPEDVYNAADFYRDAIELILQSLQVGRIPLLVGGSMMYFSVLENGLASLPEANKALRADIEAKAALYGWSYWHDYLQAHDPATAARLSPQDSQRLQRAVEVWKQTGKSLHQLQHESSQPGIATILAEQMPNTPLIKIGLAVRDKALHSAALKSRLLHMLESGFIEEVDALYHHQGIDLSLSAINSVGYKQLWQYLQGRLTYTETLSEMLVANRRLAKHQMTWLRAWSDVQLFYCDAPAICDAIYHAIYQQCSKINH